MSVQLPISYKKEKSISPHYLSYATKVQEEHTFFASFLKAFKVSTQSCSFKNCSMRGKSSAGAPIVEMRSGKGRGGERWGEGRNATAMR